MMRHIRFILFFCLIFSVHSLMAQSNFVASESKVTFKIKNMGLMVDGTLGGFEVKANLNDSDMTSSTFEASLKTETIDTGIKARDKHLRNEDYFEVTTYPKMTFKSTKITKTSSGYQAEGKLTIKDKTKTVKIPFTVKKSGNKSTLSGSFKINRLDYGVGESSWVMSSDVTISIVCVLN